MELYKFVSFPGENGAKLGTTTSVLIIYGLGKAIELGVSIIMVAIWSVCRARSLEKTANGNLVVFLSKTACRAF